jgi:hypothetical protein
MNNNSSTPYSSDDARRAAASNSASSLSRAALPSSTQPKLTMLLPSSSAAVGTSPASSSFVPPFTISSSASAAFSASASAAFSAGSLSTSLNPSAPGWTWAEKPHTSPFADDSVWNGFLVKLNSNNVVIDHDVARCKFCSGVYSWCNSTSALGEHLMARHSRTAVAQAIASSRRQRVAKRDQATQLLLSHGMSAADAADTSQSKRVRSTIVLTNALQAQSLTNQAAGPAPYAECVVCYCSG